MKSTYFSRPVLTGLFALAILTAALCAGSVTSSVSSARRAKVDTPEVDSIRVISLPTNDIVFNSVDQQLYASTPSSAGLSLGNRIVRVSPHTGIVGGSVYVGSEPSKLVLTSDNQSIYVYLAGAFAMRKYDVATQTPGNKFSIGIAPGWSGIYAARDFAVAPDDPSVVAVARYYPGSSPPQAGVAIYKNGVPLTQTGPGHSEGAHYLAFSGTGSTLYGTNDYGVKTMSVTTSGVTVQPGVISAAAYSPIKFDSGKLLSSYGHVVDTATGSLLGTLPGAESVAFVSDVAAGRAYYLVKSTPTTGILKAYDLATFTPSGSFTIPGVGGTPTSLVRWGTNGLAFRTTAGQLFLVQTSLIPTENPLPEPPPLPTPSPTPTPAYIGAFVRKLQIPANDAVYSAPTNSVLVAVPGAAGTGLGNTITHVNPMTGQTQSSNFIGSEPNKLALSNDGLSLYAKLDGANAIRRYNVGTQTAGLQFPLPAAYPNPKEIEVKPGQPDTIAVAVGYDGVAIFDNGVMRPVVTDGGAYSIDMIEFSSNPEVLYGADDSYLMKFTLTPQGSTGTLVGYGLISGNYARMKYSNGLLYASSGRVIDPENPSILGTYPVDSWYPYPVHVVDSAAGRVYFLKGNVIEAYDRDTFLKLGSVTLPQVTGDPIAISRWGANGFLIKAYESGNWSDIYLVQTSLISDDVPVPIGMQLWSATVTSNESAPSVTIIVTRSGDISRSSTVNYATQDGTATAGSDYIAQNGTLSFAAGEMALGFAVPLINDNVFEGSETFSVVLSNPGGEGVELLSPSIATVTVADNDQRPFVSNSDASVTEPTSGNTIQIDVPVQLSHPSVETITVNYSTSDLTAIAGSDYVASSGTITFAPLETAKAIPVQILGDSLPEGDETFRVTLSSPINATISVGQSVVTIRNAATRAFDFDGDGKTDIGIFRPSVAEWWINRSSNGVTTAGQFGASTDNITPADFTGDGKTDIAFFRPSTGEWFVLRSEDSSYFSFPFGTNGDIPAPADFDADGKSDATVFRPSTSTWFVRRSTDGGATIGQFGSAGDVPVPADYDGDGKADIAIYRPSLGQWWISRSSGGVIVLTFGGPSDKPVQGDFTGDGKTDIAIWRPSTGEWFILRSEDYSYFSFPFGTVGDIPAPGDYDGDGKFDATVFRPSSATWYAQRSTAGILIQQFGSNGDRPVANAFVP